MNVISMDGDPVHVVTLAEGAPRFLERMARRGARPNTVRAYRTDLDDFARFAVTQRVTVCAAISDRLTDRWLDALSIDGICRRSQARKLTVLRMFCKFARREGWMTHDPCKDAGVKFHARRVVAPELDALLRLVESVPHGAQATPADLRDYAALRLCLDAGLRISELLGLDVGADQQSCLDIHREMVCVVSKGGDVDAVPIGAATIAILQRYITEARPKLAAADEPALFVSNRGTRITRAAMHCMLVRRAAAAGIERMHWHLLRHRRIAQVVETLGLPVAQDFARHAHASTTQHYGAHAKQVSHRLLREHCGLDQAGRAA